MPVTARDGLEVSGGNSQTCYHWLLIPSTEQLFGLYLQSWEKYTDEEEQPQGLHTWWGCAEIPLSFSNDQCGHDQVAVSLSALLCLSATEGYEACCIAL